MREPIDKYFIKLANLVGTRGTCDRGRAGTVIVREKQIISTGYVGAPVGMDHCDDVGHYLVDGHCLRSTHAEQNALINSARNGVSTDNATLYCTMTPCFTCAKMIVNAGIKRVVADYDYHESEETKNIFSLAKITLTILHDKVKTYTALEQGIPL